MSFKEYKDKVIHHEVGHWVAANALGYKAGHIQVKIIRIQGTFSHQASAHVDLHPSLISIEDVEKYLVDRISILWAGMMMQGVVDATDVNVLMEQEGSSDHSKLRELCFVLRGIRHPLDSSSGQEIEQINEIYNETWNHTHQLLNDNESLAKKITNKLCELVEVPDKEYKFSRETLLSWIIEN